MNCGRILACLKNVTLYETDDGNNQTIHVARHTEETLIDSETYTINKVCFSLALLFATAHIILLIYFRRVCRLYGICIVLELICFMLMQLLILTSCSLTRDNHWGVMVGKLTDFTIMAAISTNLMSAVHICRQLWLGATLTPLGSVKTVTDNIHFQFGRLTVHWPCLPFYTMLSVLAILGLPACVLLVGSQLPERLILHDEYGEFANISCNVVPDYQHLYVFFPAIASLLISQFVCLIVSTKLRYSNRQDSFLLVHLPHLTVRLWITVKLAITYTLIWIIAFVAIFHASVALWHVFTLLCSLQSIYVAVNCVFSRPVLDLIHQWHEDKLEELKAEHAMLCRSLKRIHPANLRLPGAHSGPGSLRATADQTLRPLQANNVIMA